MILLREAREEAKLTQKQLAELSNVPQQTISAIESGARMPGADTLYQLSAALGQNMDDLYVGNAGGNVGGNADGSAGGSVAGRECAR